MKTDNRIVCIFNYAPHYRNSIYRLMANEFGCDFYFGRNLPDGEPLRKMDVQSLPGFKKESRVFRFRYVWQCDVVRQAFKGYQVYILTGNPTLSNIVFMFFARLFRKRVFLWTHGLKKLEQGKNPLVRFFLMNATGYFLYGNFGREMMLKFGIPEERLFVINNSLDYDKQLEIRKQLKTDDLFEKRFGNNDPVIFFSGRLLKYKKIEMVLEAQKILAASCPFNLVLVGDGPQRVDLEHKADQLGLAGRVWFYGECYDEHTIGTLFYNAALTVSPGNVGLTAIHSMMYGTPVLTHDNAEHQGPEYEAVEDGRTGSFFKENDVSDLASKIEQWITKRNDRENIRNQCFAVIDKYFNPHYSLEVIKKAIKL
jgi:glycosyltransferase involved in cell wall biosynthesis